jgi:hypothetical protein
MQQHASVIWDQIASVASVPVGYREDAEYSVTLHSRQIAANSSSLAVSGSLRITPDAGYLHSWHVQTFQLGQTLSPRSKGLVDLLVFNSFGEGADFEVISPRGRVRTTFDDLAADAIRAGYRSEPSAGEGLGLVLDGSSEYAGLITPSVRLLTGGAGDDYSNRLLLVERAMSSAPDLSDPRRN